MKAIYFMNYGLPDELQLKEIEKPIPKDDEVLIRIHATSINGSDYEFLRGKPFYARLIGLRKPHKHILGSDIAGIVEAIGSKVTKFQPNDKVFGDNFEKLGGFAEYVCAPEKVLRLKPDTISFEQAASLPQAACIALQGIRELGKVQPNQKVLINGAGGSAGSFAVQFAKFYGAEVTGVDNSNKLESIRSWGADNVIDYTKQDFTKNGQQYDLIFDLIGYHPLSDFKHSLKPGGKYFLVGGSLALIFKVLFLGPWISMINHKKMGILALNSMKNLDDIISMIESGKINPIIDKRYSLMNVPDAFRYIQDGQASGKIVIKIADKSDI